MTLVLTAGPVYGYNSAEPGDPVDHDGSPLDAVYDVDLTLMLMQGPDFIFDGDSLSTATDAYVLVGISIEGHVDADHTATIDCSFLGAQGIDFGGFAAPPGIDVEGVGGFTDKLLAGSPFPADPDDRPFAIDGTFGTEHMWWDYDTLMAGGGFQVHLLAAAATSYLLPASSVGQFTAHTYSWVEVPEGGLGIPGALTAGSPVRGVRPRGRLDEDGR